MTVVDALTVLTAKVPLAKTIKHSDGVGFEVFQNQIAKSFDVSEEQVQSIGDIHDVLSKLQGQTHQAVIRGKLIEGISSTETRRLSRPSGDTPASFEDCPRRWVMLDIDDLSLPEDFRDIDGKADEIISHAVSFLPSEFESAKCVYQWSGSMGVKTDKIRVHLWYWLHRPVSDQELKAWLSDSPVDKHLFNPVQIHYTANPILGDGVVEPIKKRVGLFEPEGATDTVAAPDDLEVLQPKEKMRRTVGASGIIDDQEIVRDQDTGLVIDGRERLLLQCSNKAMRDLLSDSSDGAPSIEAIENLTWDLFSAEADLSDGKWDKTSARKEAERRVEELEAGSYTFTSRHDATILVPTSGPFENPEFVSRDEGQVRLEEGLSRLFERIDKQPKMALRITMGAGKTQQTLRKLRDYLAENRGKRVEIYVPRHDLAQQYVQDIEELGGFRAKVIHVKPRSDTRDRDIKGQCLRPIFAESLTSAGLGVFRNACMSVDGQTCKHFHDCPYIKQFDEQREWDEGADAGNVVRIFVHDYLRLPRNQLQSDPDLVIIDEAFWQGLVSTDRSLSRSELRTHVKTAQFPELGRWFFEALEDEDPLLKKLREEGVDAQELTEIDLSALKPDVAFAANSNCEVTPSGNPSLYYRLSMCIRILKEELKLGRQEVERLVFDAENDRIRLLDNSQPDIPETAAILMLDATADETVLRKVFDDVELIRIDVKQKAVVSQVYDRTGSKAHWEGNTAEIKKLIDVANTWAEFGENPLIISFKSVINKLEETGRLNTGVKLNHFGALRGSNEATDCSVAFIVGRMMPAPLEVDLQARALFWDDKETLGHDDSSTYLPLSQRGYLQSDRNPKPQSGVMVPTFTDQRIDTLFRQIQDAETMQALGRLRMVHSKQVKRVFLLSNLPVSIPVDHLVEFSELMPDRLEYELIKNGNIPLTPLGLLKMRPDITTNSSTARTKIERSRIPTAASIRMFPSLANATIFEATFRAGDQRLTEHRHLFLVRGKQDQGVVVGPVPDLNEIQTFLEHGDPEIEGSGWGQVQDLRLDFWAAGLDEPIP